MFLAGYDCITAAGVGYENLLKSLYAGTDHSILISENQWNRSIVPGGKVCLIPEYQGQKYLDRFSLYSQIVWKNLWNLLESSVKEKLIKKKILVILSSTKGFIEDYIWEKNFSNIRLTINPYQKIVDQFIENNKSHFNFVESIVVSNACASSHVAMQVAKNYFQHGDFESIVIIATDLIGPFIYNGFQSLKVLSQTKNRPFSANRDGLQLGEALAILVFQKNSTQSSGVYLKSVASDTEGGSVTKPSMDGTSLFRTLKQVVSNQDEVPDFSIAHGTGTVFNDLSESRALHSFSEKFDRKFPVTGIKWSIGHTLGASGALDIIVASEVLKSGKLFALANSDQLDPKLLIGLVYAKEKVRKLDSVKSAIVTSLGFGGVHAAARLERLS